MLSFRGRIIKFLLQNRHLLQLRLKKENPDWNKYESILGFRATVEKGAGKFGKLPVDINVVPAIIDKMAAEWILPAGARKDRIILYFHGGGYISGSLQAHRGITARFVKGSGIGALLFQYRLAPESPYPAALNDSVTAYKNLLEQG